MLHPEADRLLRSQPWPGNVRELESAVIRALVACRGDTLEAHHFDLVQEAGEELTIREDPYEFNASAVMLLDEEQA